MNEPAGGSKAEWRVWARSHHAAGVADRAAERIVAHARAYLERLPKTTVVLFAAMPGEVAVDSLATTPRHRFGLTRTPATGWLTIHEWDTPREVHRFGFSQPMANAPCIPLAEVGLVLVPGLAFDEFGYRLGHGAGYYDELFTRLPATVRRIGLTPAALVVERLPVDDHDVAMELLITEDGVIPPSTP